jgi:hypothetical protein
LGFGKPGYPGHLWRRPLADEITDLTDWLKYNV